MELSREDIDMLVDEAVNKYLDSFDDVVDGLANDIESRMEEQMSLSNRNMMKAMIRKKIVKGIML